MKHKKSVILIVVAVLLVAVLTSMLTACLKIGMRKDNLKKRMEEYGATVTYSRTCPVITGWQSKGINIKDILVVTMGASEEENGDEESEENGGETVNTKLLYVIYASDKDGAKWIMEKCKAYKSAEENAELCANWALYEYEDDYIIMFGDRELLAVARQY